MMLGAAEADQLIFVFVLMASSILSAAYLFPILARAFFKPLPYMTSSDTDGIHTGGIQEAPMFSLVAISIAATGTFLMFFYAGNLAEMLAPLAATMAKP